MLLAQSLTLPCGVRLKNRFVKSAMSEILANQDHAPTEALVTAYQRWAKGGTGLLITGNVMIDKRALGEPQNVVVENERALEALRAWAKAGERYNCPIWVQLNHPGKQSPSFLSPEPVAPSAIPLEGALKAGFNKARALRTEEVWDLVARFANSARICKKAGFHGVQIHGAHGYLVSQFLSGKSNQRQDEFGGTFEKRCRFVLEIYKAMRQAVGKEFPISIKLNSSDFQKGGFTEEESTALMQELCKEGIDLIEISGGNYERPVMMGGKESSDREAYFSKFAQNIKSKVSCPIVLTGGFRTAPAMEEALRLSHCDFVGLARPLALDPDLPNKILSGDKNYSSSVQRVSTGILSLDMISMLNITWYEQQIAYLGKGKEPNKNLNPFLSIFRSFCSLGVAAFKKRRA